MTYDDGCPFILSIIADLCILSARTSRDIGFVVERLELTASVCAGVQCAIIPTQKSKTMNYNNNRSLTETDSHWYMNQTRFEYLLGFVYEIKPYLKHIFLALPYDSL